MSEPTDCKQQSKTNKRSASPEQGCSSPPGKAAKVQDDIQELALGSSGCRNGEAVPIESGGEREHREAEIDIKAEERDKSAHIKTNFTPSSTGSANERPTNSSGVAEPAACGGSGESERPVETAVAGAPGRSSVLLKGPGHGASHQQSDWAAIAAAEALASLTGGDGDSEKTDRPHSGKKAEIDQKGPGKRDTPIPADCTDSPQRVNWPKTRAVAADSSTSVPEGGAVLGTAETERVDRSRDTEDEDEDDEDSLLGSSSSPDFSSGSEDCTAEDAECAIVSVKMAPETRQAVAQLARLQMQLETLERKGVRQHQRLELKLNQQRRPHLDQRGAIIKDIPGFWVTALLNHPQLSAHIDENDEDALSYMTNLEIENNGMGHRIGFHFRRNPYFQNSVIVKELHLALGGSAMSFSNPILWHRGQNLTARTRLVKGPGAFQSYPSFFTWFSDHSSPERDEIAQIMKNDLYRNPLRYYLTPMWEPRLNGSVPRTANNSNSSDCVVISDSDDEDDDGDYEEEEPAVNRREEEQDAGKSSEEEDEEVRIDGSEEDEDGEADEEDGITQGREGEEDEDLDVEELEETEGCGAPEATEQEDVEVDEEGEES